MRGLTALNPWFLAGALAALVPLIIHLIERRRLKRVVFGSVIFLRGLVKRMARRRRTSELILLVLRMAVLALVALAFARPLFRSADARGIAGGRKAVAILVDRSGSMGVGTRMADARARATAVVNNLRGGDACAVYAFGARVEPLVPWTDEREPARAALAKIAATEEATDIASALRETAQALAQRPEPARSLVLVSDLQAAGWAGYANDWTMPDGVDLALSRIGDDNVPANVGIVKTAVPAQAVVGSGEEVLTAQIHNAGPERRSLAVRLELAGKEIASKDVGVPPGASTAVSFRYAFEESGEVPGRFLINGDDAFAADDSSAFVVSVKPKIGVVLVNGSADTDPKRNDGYYLKRALAPSAESIFAVTEVRPDGLFAVRLSDTGVVVLADVDTLPADAQRKLSQFVQSGGGVIFFPGAQTNPANFNRTFADVSPCLLDRVLGAGAAAAEDRAEAVIGDVDFRNPVFGAFWGPHHGDFSRIAFSRYFAVTDSQAGSVLARFDNGRPAVLIKKIGRGASLMVVSAADLEMNNFALRAVFLPFVHQAARHLAGFGVARETAVRVGDTIAADVQPGIAEVALTSPAGVASRVAVTPGDTPDGGGIARFVATERGFYRVDAGASTRLFAVNADPAEGELVCLHPDEIAASLTARRGEPGGLSGVLVEGRRVSDEEIERSQRIGWMMLVAAVVLLAAETALARKIAADQV